MPQLQVYEEPYTDETLNYYNYNAPCLVDLHRAYSTYFNSFSKLHEFKFVLFNYSSHATPDYRFGDIFDYLKENIKHDILYGNGYILLDSVIEVWPLCWNLFSIGSLWDNIKEACEKYGIPAHKIVYLCCNHEAKQEVIDKGKYNSLPIHILPYPYYETYVREDFKKIFDSVGQLKNYILDAQQYTKYPAISINRRARTWRHLSVFLFDQNPNVLTSFLETNKTKNWHSARNVLIERNETELLKEFDEWVKTLPKVLDREYGPPEDFRRPHNATLFHQACFQYVSESRTQGGKYAYPITEKTFRALAYGHPFIAFGPQNFHKKLEEIGYTLYTPWFDYSFDREADDWVRCKKVNAEVSKQVKYLNQLSYRDLVRWKKAMQEKTFFNVDRLFDTTYLDNQIYHFLKEIENNNFA